MGTCGLPLVFVVVFVAIAVWHRDHTLFNLLAGEAFVPEALVREAASSPARDADDYRCTGALVMDLTGFASRRGTPAKIRICCDAISHRQGVVSLESLRRR
jgi:hypothetical protein